MNPHGASEGYRYPPTEGAQPGAVDVINALREFRTSETAMRRRTRSSVAMGETDLLALRYLIDADAAGTGIRPTELAARLGITSASMTSLVDRLVANGYVTREPHPSDRRAVILRPTPGADEEVRHNLNQMHTRMLEAAESLSQEEIRAVMHFLMRMREAVDAVNSPAGATVR
ncbi:MarR family transcriptional regulator [Pseudarthrobacter phenanthrenivorans]|jgi:DNA-binding MarR family transcriptional regulator|uniref:MarR family transcriptional regulator n=1 Tax=Pseudarthrobacter phenanthrenivorans TaxID=361575 RepID=A0A0B4ERR1_PSEPS|nr:MULTISPECIES: MarR family transcriptional regulator [Micrococcaceae]KIC69408.1 MarR family transcriptional regulator [Pseudarthrobacter phenanthrenivorans]MDJ0455892.1 MarR family transcriptional regulator [Arthrobacter sp. NQ7]